MIINRYQLISILIRENGLTENEREFVAKMPDSKILTISGRPQFKILRKGYYILN